MTQYHAVLFLGDCKGKVLQLDAQQRIARSLKLRCSPTARYGNGARAGQEFFTRICNALMDIPEVLVTGSLQALPEFQRYIEENRPQAVRHIVGYEVVEQASDAQLIGLARRYFSRYEAFEA